MPRLWSAKGLGQQEVWVIEDNKLCNEPLFHTCRYCDKWITSMNDGFDHIAIHKGRFTKAQREKRAVLKLDQEEGDEKAQPGGRDVTIANAKATEDYRPHRGHAEDYPIHGDGGNTGSVTKSWIWYGGDDAYVPTGDEPTHVAISYTNWSPYNCGDNA